MSFVLYFCIQKSLRSRPPVAIGDKVIAKHRNGRYYHCVVTSFNDTVYYNVAFQDGSFSNDMFPEDIQVNVVTFIRSMLNVYCVGILTGCDDERGIAASVKEADVIVQQVKPYYLIVF